MPKRMKYPDKFSKALVDSDAQPRKDRSGAKGPSPNPATNLLIADIVLRSASSLFRDNVEKKIARANYEDEQTANDLIDSRTMLTTLALYGITKVATRSKAGLALVTGGLALKTLYDIGKAREKRSKPLRDDLDPKG